MSFFDKKAYTALIHVDTKCVYVFILLSVFTCMFTRMKRILEKGVKLRLIQYMSFYMLAVFMCSVFNTTWKRL